jgi:hypothetical protein
MAFTVLRPDSPGTPVPATLAAPFAARIIARFPGADGLTGLPDGAQ